MLFPKASVLGDLQHQTEARNAAEAALFAKRMMGLEPTTFCMASRRSSQLSYIRVGAQYSLRFPRPGPR